MTISIESFLDERRNGKFSRRKHRGKAPGALQRQLPKEE